MQRLVLSRFLIMIFLSLLKFHFPRVGAPHAQIGQVLFFLVTLVILIQDPSKLRFSRLGLCGYVLFITNFILREILLQGEVEHGISGPPLWLLSFSGGSSVTVSTAVFQGTHCSSFFQSSFSEVSQRHNVPPLQGSPHQA